MKGPSMLSSRWVSIVVDNEIKLCKNMFPAFFLRVQLRPASASDCRYVLSDALYTSLQGFNQVIIRWPLLMTSSDLSEGAAPWVRSRSGTGGGSPRCWSPSRWCSQCPGSPSRSVAIIWHFLLKESPSPSCQNCLENFNFLSQIFKFLSHSASSLFLRTLSFTE